MIQSGKLYGLGVQADSLLMQEARVLTTLPFYLLNLRLFLQGDAASHSGEAAGQVRFPPDVIAKIGASRKPHLAQQQSSTARERRLNSAKFDASHHRLAIGYGRAAQ